MTNKKGFTIVELIVVITIIAIISIIGLTIFTQVAKQARDGRRKEDLQSIASALEIYYQVNQHYPGSGTPYLSSNGGAWIPELIPGSNPSQYLNKGVLPKDPVKDVGNPTAGQMGYYYRTANGTAECNSGGNQYFLLAAHLESNNDPDRLGAKAITWCGISLSGPPLNYDGNEYILTNP